MLRVPLANLVEGRRSLDRDTARYVTRVHRLGAGDRLVGFDPEARREADLELVVVERVRVEVVVGPIREATRLASRPLVVVQALGKGSKIEASIRDATELGASRFIVVSTERSVKQRLDLGRARRIAIEAARQCLRGDVPSIEGPLLWEEALARPRPGAVGLMLHPEGAPFAPAVDTARGAWVAIGPEGGFTTAELSSAEAHGFVKVRLGPFVMRTETAAAASLGALHALWATD
ncbi:MAG: RsmE family RNA methyltransferase [Myxococcota bacterium]